jgi:Holliday junction resolvase-like predicted endonuclease
MGSKHKVSSILIGVAGEYFVAAELSRRGYVASITLRNTRGIDIIASNEDGDKTVNIQVKTKRIGVPDWIVTKKAENVKDANMFYVFVSLGKDTENPDFHIVPSKDVADYVKKGHKKWLETPGRGGKMHKDTPIRIFDDKENKYLDKWELLGLD